MTTEPIPTPSAGIASEKRNPPDSLPDAIEIISRCHALIDAQSEMVPRSISHGGLVARLEKLIRELRLTPDRAPPDASAQPTRGDGGTGTRWIPLAQQKPEEHEDVLAIWANQSNPAVRIAKRIADKWRDVRLNGPFFQLTPTHWMPISALQDRAKVPPPSDVRAEVMTLAEANAKLSHLHAQLDEKERAATDGERLEAALRFILDECDWEEVPDPTDDCKTAGGDDRIGKACRDALAAMTARGRNGEGK